MRKRENRRERDAELLAIRHAERRKIIDEMKLKAGCIDCGYNKCAAALHFDHRDPMQKSFQIAQNLNKKWEKVLAEIAKCDIRCANCHTERTVSEHSHLMASSRKYPKPLSLPS